MVLLQAIILLISRYIPSNCLSAKLQFDSTEKFFQAAAAREVKPEAKFFPKITSLVELFLSEIFGNSPFLAYFHTFLNIFGQNEWPIRFSQPIYGCLMGSLWLIFKKSDTFSLTQLHSKIVLKMVYTIYINCSTYLHVICYKRHKKLYLNYCSSKTMILP